MTERSRSFIESFAAKMAIGLVIGFSVAIFAYSVVRLVDVVLFPEPNPVIVVWTERSRFVWRAVIAAYLGGASVFGGYSLASRTSERVPIWLERIILAAALCLLGQSIFAP